MGWVDEKEQDSVQDRMYSPKFLALRGSSLFKFSAPPVSCRRVSLRSVSVDSVCLFVAEPDFPHLMLMPRRGGGIFLSRLLSVVCAASIFLLIDDVIKSVYLLPAIR